MLMEPEVIKFLWNHMTLEDKASASMKDEGAGGDITKLPTVSLKFGKLNIIACQTEDMYQKWKTAKNNLLLAKGMTGIGIPKDVCIKAHENCGATSVKDPQNNTDMVSGYTFSQWQKACGDGQYIGTTTCSVEYWLAPLTETPDPF